MGEPINPAELALVCKAIALGETTGGCCEWNEKAARRIRERPPCEGLTPEGVRQLLIEFVVRQGGKVIQVKERRAEHPDRQFYYKAIVPVASFVHGLFVELVVTDDDDDYPSVAIVNAHEQTR
jgi:hypothetical protein